MLITYHNDAHDTMSREKYIMVNIFNTPQPPTIYKEENVNWDGLVISITWREKKDQLDKFIMKGLHRKSGRIIKLIWVPLYPFTKVEM